MADVDDERLGLLARKIRRRIGLTQERLSELSNVPVEDICEIERGGVGRVLVDRVRAVFATLDGRLYLNPWWKGASADRLLDEDHAEMGELATSVLSAYSWQRALEVTFSDYGDRGSIDLFGAREADRAVAVCEIKSAFGSLEETNRSLDVKVRLAPKIAEQVFGWRPRYVGRILIVRDDPVNRRVVSRHAATMDSIYPLRGRAIRAWLRRPTNSISGLWFLTIPAVGGTVSDG